MKKIYSLLLSFSFLLIAESGFGQNTFTTVFNILQTNCATSGCHSGSGATGFNASASANDLYTALVNAAPANSAAVSKGNKLVDPGHPYNSFLLRKIGAHGFDPFIKLDNNENDTVSAHANLQKYEIELLRQWIIAGAQQTGNVVNYQVLKDYYNNGGIEFIPAPPAPAAGQGFQVRFGPLFLAPGEEVEMMKKEHLKNSAPIKIQKLGGGMSWQSHHMLLFKFDNGGVNTREGARKVPTEDAPFNGPISLTAAWQDEGDFDLPPGTAITWEENTILDFDYHIKNYDNNLILPTDFYLNVYYYNQPETPIEMYAQLEQDISLGGGFTPWLTTGRTRRSSEHNPGGAARYIWLLTSHTHKFGTDYDIFLKNSDDSKGDQIYEGFYNVDYTLNQGYYDWEHPAIRKFDPLVKAENGLIYETEWNVVNDNFVTFGLTTEDEMMLFTYFYTLEPLKTTTSVKNIQNNAARMSVYPNPFKNSAEINFTIERSAEVKLELFDVLGKRISTVLNENFAAGTHTRTIDANELDDPGIYFITYLVDGKKVATKKITKL